MVVEIRFDFQRGLVELREMNPLQYTDLSKPKTGAPDFNNLTI